MRKRFRGNQPVSTSAELEGGESGGAPGGAGAGMSMPGYKSGQLYGGKPAFESVKERTGFEKESQMDPEKTRGL